VESRWENYTLTGFVSKPTDARPSRNMQTFFVNDRPVRSKLLISALEEAYRNQLMVGKFPACVLHLRLPANAVDVNVHPAKTEVKFLSEKAVFDCVHYGVLGALNKQVDRPQVQFKPNTTNITAPAVPAAAKPAPKQETFFRTMTAEEYRNFSTAVQSAPQPKPAAAAATVKAVEQQLHGNLQETVFLPKAAPAPIKPEPVPVIPEPEAVQETIVMPEEIPWRMVGELYNSYIIVEQGEDAFLIDKHAAHERILFEKLKANQEAISSQMLLTPVPVRLRSDAAAELLSNTELLSELGFEVEEFGDSTVLLRQIPMDLSPEAAAEAAETLASDLLKGRRERKDTIRDELLHTVACKAAIKAGWDNDETELLALVKQVMAREDLKYCPHGRPICVTLSKKQLEKQFKRI
jgi:DNA mismatch repair protein MutL